MPPSYAAAGRARRDGAETAVPNRAAPPDHGRGQPGTRLPHATRAGHRVGRGRARPAPGAFPSELAANAALVLGAGLITAYLGFEAGGYFPGSTSVVAVGLGVALILRVGLAKHPFEGFRRRTGVPLASLALFAIWTLVSSCWSHAPGRAVLEGDRVLLYLGALVLFGSLVRRDGRLPALAGGVALGSVVVATAGLLTRTLPGVFPIGPDLATDRLAYPLSYGNALGLLTALGILVCLGLSAAERVPRLLRVAAAGAVPALAATLLLTFSRGAIAAGLVGLGVLCAFCPMRALFLALVASAPAAAFACQAVYAATALAGQDPTGPAAVAQGRHLAIVVALSSLAAVLLRAGLSRWDFPPARPRTASRRMIAASAVLLLLGTGAAAVAFNLPHQLSRQYHHFVIGNQLPTNQQARERLLNPANNGRLAIWRVAADTWTSQPFHGDGAGTFQLQWNRYRTGGYVVNAHSLYLGTLADLGVVGLALLLVCLTALLSATAMQIRTPERAVPASLFAASICWMLHAGIDWDWEMPAITWWLFAAGGLALARSPHSRPALAPPRRLGRLLLMLGVGLIALLPAQVGLSQLHLTRAVSAFRQGNCNATVSNALKSVADLGARAEPYEIMSYCDARDGNRHLALAMIQNAINRDPQNWEFHYDMAIVRGATGLDPRRAAQIARALNPLSPLTTSLAQAVQRPDPRIWRALALTAPLLVPGQPILRLATASP